MAPPGGVPDVGGSVWSPPARVDEYHLLRRLGQGGMGTVHVARDTLLDRLVAIKFILAPEPDEVLRQRFQNEARALAKLAHPNVVTIHRVGEIGGRPYIVCELVEGKTLAQLKPPLPASRVLDIGASAARGLAAVHRHGLLHRDIKPANIAVMPDGEAKLLDFGLAKIADPAPLPPPDPDSPSPNSADATDDWALTAEGRAVGTRAYIAPEIVGGAPASRKSDVYSLGAVLYELCAGYPPSRNLPDRAPACEDEALAGVIARCLEEDPDLRYRSGDDLREALEELLPGAHESPVPAGNPYPGLRAFEADERSLFFGRLPESRAVLDRLRSEAIVLVAGDSGVGKSSLCRAGVLPIVADGQLDPTRVWRVVTVLPGRRPLLALAAALASHLGLTEERAADLVRAEPGALGRTLRRRLGNHEALLVFVDQAEELVSLADPVEAAQVTEALASLGLGPLRVLATVRGDLFTRVAALPGLADALPGALYLLRRLSKPQLRVAIVTPALRAGGRFESDALVDTLVDAAADAPGGVALLSFTLAELWQRRDPVRQVIAEAALAEVGGVAGALAQHADGLLAGLPAEQRAAVPRLLTRLVTAEGSRVRRTAAELDPARGPGRDALEALVRGRLLVAGAADGGTTAYEIAHEALLVSWSTLRGWLAGDAAARAKRQRIETVAAEWKRLDEDPSLLFGARQLFEIDDAELAEPARSFVGASRRAARRKRNGAIAAAVAAVLFAGVVYDALRIQARHHLADLIAAQRAPAVGALVIATAGAAVATALRRGAVTRFRDPGEGPAPAESVWQAALDDSGRAHDLDALAESDLVSASQALEAALLLDPDDPETRRLLAEVTALRLELAERNFQTRARAELRLRLRAYAAGTPLAGLLDADARLTVVTAPAGAAVVLERYADVGGVLRAVDPVELGASPIAARPLAPGSYRLRLEAPGRAPVRYPILLAPGERFEARVGLPPASAVPAGTIYVPPGRFRFGSADDEGLRRFLMAPPEHEVTTDGYLIGKNEVTFAEYFEFLRDLPAAERAVRLPHAANAIRGTLALEEQRDGRFRLTIQPASARYSAVEGEPIRYRGRERRAVEDWRRFPVAAISWSDARAYVAWLDRTGRLPHARLCTEHEWERAARGADDRIYPHGYRIAPDDADIDVTYGRRPEAYGPDEVGAHPDSDSPFGVEDLVGNVWEWTESVQQSGQPSLRGGSYYQEEFTDRVTNRDVGEPDARDPLVGMRVCASLSVAPPL